MAGINPKHWQVITTSIVLVLGVSAGLFFYQWLKARKKSKKSEPLNGMGMNK